MSRAERYDRHSYSFRVNVLGYLLHDGSHLQSKCKGGRFHRPTGKNLFPDKQILIGSGNENKCTCFLLVNMIVAASIQILIMSSPCIDAVYPSPTYWVKYANNPVLSPGQNGSWDSSYMGLNPVIYDCGTYRLFYCAGSRGYTSEKIGYAFSLDGKNWTKYAGNPVLTPGEPGSWESLQLGSGVVIKDGSVYKMWYSGYNGSLWNTGYATSSDCMSWTKYAGNPVMSVGASNGWEGKGVFPLCVIKENNVYKMWYSGWDGDHGQTGYATSPDGLSWTRYASNPIVATGPPGSYDYWNVIPCTVINVSGTYQMWYAAYDSVHAGIAYATSGDGINWTKYANNPIMTRQGDGWERHHNLDPAVIFNGTGYQMWFIGVDDRTEPWTYQIGYAEGWTSIIPPALTFPPDRSWTNISKPLFTWTFNDANPKNRQGSFQLQISDGPDFSSVIYDSGKVSSAAVTHTIDTAIPDGGYFWRVQDWNTDDECSGWSPPQGFGVDTTTPKNPTTLTSPSHVIRRWNNVSVVDVRWSVPSGGGDMSGYNGFSTAWGSSASTVPDTTVELGPDILNASSNPMPDGDNIYFHIRARDNAGNWNPAAVHLGPFWIDSSPPSNPKTVSCLNHDQERWSNNSTIDMAWSEAEEGISGVAGYSYLWDDRPYTDPPATVRGSADVLKASSNMIPDGSGWYFHLRAVDAAGNWGNGAVHSGPYWIDSIPPGKPVNLTSTSHVIGQWSSSNIVDISWAASDGGPSGISGYSYLWDNSPDTSPQEVQSANGEALAASSPPLADGGDWYFHIRARDGAGNWAQLAAHIGPFLINTTPPEPSNLAPVFTNSTGPDNITLRLSGPLNFSVDAYDPEGKELVYRWYGNGTLLGTGGDLSCIFPPGSHLVVIEISDGAHSVSRTFHFTILPPPSAPADHGGSPLSVPPEYVAAGAVAAPALICASLFAGTEVIRYRFILFFLPLFNRLHKEQVLDNELRGIIRGYIGADPGIHYNELVRLINVAKGTVAYHLTTLEREGVIKSRRDGVLKRFYPGEMKLLEIPVRLSGVQLLILRTVQRQEGLSQSKVAAALDLPYLTVHRQINKMVGLGVLRLDKWGISTRCFVEETWKGYDTEKRSMPLPTPGLR